MSRGLKTGVPTPRRPIVFTLILILKLLHLFILALILLLSQSFANAQTIPQKKFTKVGAPVFLADGFANFSAAFRNQTAENRPALGNDSQLFLKSGVMTQSQAKYGAVAKVELNVNTDGRRENPNFDQAFLFAESEFGKVEIGNNQAVNQKMKTGPASFARGAGGINGKYLENINLASKGSFILLAQSPIGHGGYAAGSANYSQKNNFRALKDNSFDGVEDATKLSCYAPRIEGLQFGASYAPNSQNKGFTTTKYYHNSVATIRDILSFGANYSDDFDNLGVEISATTEKGRVKKTTDVRQNLFAYDMAAKLDYFGFSLGASFGSWENSLQKASDVSVQSSRANYYTLGLAYAFGPMAASITSLKSQFQKNDYAAISLGLDYKLAKDLMPYFELTKFAFKANQASASGGSSSQAIVTNNQGYVFLTGILISF